MIRYLFQLFVRLVIDKDESKGILIPFTMLMTRDGVAKGDGLNSLTAKEITDRIMP